MEKKTRRFERNANKLISKKERMKKENLIKKYKGKDFNLLEHITGILTRAYEGKTDSHVKMRIELDNIRIDKLKISDMKFDGQRIAIGNYLREKLLIFSGLTKVNVIKELSCLDFTISAEEYLNGLETILLPFLKENDIFLDLSKS